MDTTNARYSKEPAIIVDWDHVNTFGGYEDWIVEKQAHLEVVLLVPNPFAYDFGGEEANFAKFEPTVVLRNNGGLRDIIFKAQAVSLLQDMSNLVPVAAWDDDPSIIAMYKAAGVAFTDDLSWDED